MGGGLGRPRCWLLLALLLLPQLFSVDADVCAPPINITPAEKFCTSFNKVCVDQNALVLYANEHNPRHPRFQGLPQLQLQNIHIDYYGFGDVWGTEIRYPQPLLRPATSGEESKELRSPAFSTCTRPLVLYANYLYVYGEFFVRTIATLSAMHTKGWLDRRMTLAVASLGMRLEPHHYFLLQPFSTHNLTTLSHMSARLPLDTPEGYNPDGTHVRCFQQLVACQMSYLWKMHGLKDPLWSAGQAVLAYYKPQLPRVEFEGWHDSRRLRVVIAARSERAPFRTMINQRQVWSWCTQFNAARSAKDWHGTACELHEFGRDLLLDVAIASQADVLVGLHGAALFNAFFMAKHSSVVEIRPYEFFGEWPNMYLKDMTSKDDDHSIFWWGVNIDNPEASRPGRLELQRRGLNHTWQRDRHTNVRLMPLQYIFERISIVRRDLATYLTFRKRNQVHITDTMRNLNETQR